MIGLLFIIFLFLSFYKANGLLNGNEVSGIFYSLFYRLDWKFFPSIFLYGHEPLRGLIELPFLFKGPNELLIRLPNIFMSLGAFMVFAKIIKFLFKNKVVQLLQLAFFVFSPLAVLGRLANGMSGFYLFTLLFLYYLLLYLNKPSQFKYLKLCLGFLFISILFYSDSLFFIPPIFVLFFKRLKRNIFKEKTLLLSLVLFFIGLCFYFSLWTLIPYLAAKRGFININDLYHFGMFRILTRGKERGTIDFFYNFKTLSFYSSIFFVTFVLISSILACFNKKSHPIILLLILPLLYFHLHPKPTIHILLFYPLFILLSGFTLEMLLKKKQLNFLISLLGIVLSLANILNIRKFYSGQSINKQWTWGFYQNSQPLKAISFIVRKNSNCNDKIFSNLDGVQVNFYFGLPEKKPNEAGFIIIDYSYDTKKTDKVDKTNFINKISFYNPENKAKIELYSLHPLNLETKDINVLSKKFNQEFGRAKDIFPNIYCRNW